jgi:PhzF family phenazine biosynthesis protein
MKTRPFKQVDVFTAVPYLGNPLAVVLDGEGLSTEEMQHFANWTNLSETTFVLPPTPEGLAAGADYRVRIFTPTTELPFAGHPTLGTCYAWLEANPEQQAKTEFLQECAIGLVKIQRGSQQRPAPQANHTQPRTADPNHPSPRPPSPANHRCPNIGQRPRLV